MGGKLPPTPLRMAWQSYLPKAGQSRDEAMLQTIALSVDLIMIESSL
jgi:hypothetical protein